ncbi:MAG: helix-turn-helix transcriptional regulator [Myxococcota bacterium]
MSDADAFPDGPVWVRTGSPSPSCTTTRGRPTTTPWHQLTYALQGHLKVETDDACTLVPPDCAVWVPAGCVHREQLWAPVTVRTLYLAPGALPSPPGRARTVAVPPLLRALVVHVSGLGALDRRVLSQAHLTDVLVDLTQDLPDAGLRLPTPRDPRAQRLAAQLRADPAAPTPLATLARRAGASLRTLERCFLRETGLTVAAWRRRLRLLVAVRRLERGEPVARVAEAVGYASASAFTAAFTATFGAPPTRR